jgi:hypothetical protein
MSLQRFQLDIAARLQGAPVFANVPVFILRPRASLTAAQIQDKINASLGALTTQNGKSGLCATVLMPLLNTQKQELPGPYLHLKCTVRVQENVIVNMGPNGTQFACEDAAIAVAQSLHLWTPGGTAGIIRAAQETIIPNNSFEGKVTYDVGIESELELPCLPTTVQPLLTNTAGTITIACSDSTALIYYTLDGTTPWAGSPAYPSTAVLYSGHSFTAVTGALVRTAAFASGKLGSDIGALQL